MQKADNCGPRDQLYFERIHPAIPLLHQRSYLSWSKKDVKKKSQICVQRAMWALAALQSSQYRYLQEQLYRSCTEMLTAICSSSAGYDPFDREQIQAWLLITIYELMRSFHRQAWMSVGRAFRLVQLLRLHELDNPSHAITPAHEGFVEKEEERRAFWLAYFLDHLFGISSNWPITLNELVVSFELFTLCSYVPTTLELAVTNFARALRFAHACRHSRMTSKTSGQCSGVFCPKQSPNSRATSRHSTKPSSLSRSAGVDHSIANRITSGLLMVTYIPTGRIRP
jgi:hypothetical protein